MTLWLELDWGTRKGEREEYIHVKRDKWGKWLRRDAKRITLPGYCVDTGCDGGSEAESGAVHVGVS